MKIAVAIAAGCLLTGAIQAQSLPDKLNINFTAVLPGDADLSGNKWGYQRSEITYYRKPGNLMKKTLVFHGFGYVNNNFNFTSRTSDLSRLSTNFHDIRYTIIASSRLKNPRWSWVNAARITVRSDFKSSFSPGQEVFPFLQSVPQYAVRKDGRLKLGLGISLNNDLGYYVIAPTAMINYRNKKNNFNLDLVYPNLTMLYKPNRRTELGIIGNVEGGIYRMRSFVFADGQPAATHLQHLQLSGTAVYSYKLNAKKPYWFNIRAGYAFLRNLRMVSKNTDYNDVLRLDADNNLLLRAGWSWRFM